MSEYDINQQVASRIREELRWGEQQFKQGDCIALLDGKVIAVKENMSEALTALRQMEAEPDRGMLFRVATPTVDVIR